MLAFLNEEQISKVIDEPLIAYTNNTMTDAVEIRDELVKIRECGYAVSKGEYTADVLALAMPVFNSEEEVVGSVTVSGPTYRFTEQRIPEVLEPLTQARQEVENIIRRYHLNLIKEKKYMQHLQEIALNILKNNLNVQSSETLMILTDVHKQEIAEIFHQAGLSITENTC
ncbi:IclR family transcriptional regulator C-terminal domain-containing protein [Lysinibacillus pakistanensis]